MTRTARGEKSTQSRSTIASFSASDTRSFCEEPQPSPRISSETSRLTMGLSELESSIQHLRDKLTAVIRPNPETDHGSATAIGELQSPLACEIGNLADRAFLAAHEIDSIISSLEV